MNKLKISNLIKWAVTIIVTITPPILYFYLTVIRQEPTFISIGVALAVGLIVGHELLVLFFDYERRFEISWLLFHTNTRDYIVSIIAFLSLFIIAILNQWIMQTFDMDKFIIGGLVNIMIPVCIFLFAGSKSLRQKVLRWK